MKIREFEGRVGAIAYIHQQMVGTLSHLDAKSYILSGLSTAALVYLSNQSGILELFTILSDFPDSLVLLYSQNSWFKLFYFFTIALAVFLLAMSFGYALWAIRPRISNKTDSVIFFRGILQQKNAEAYAKIVSKLEEADLAENLSEDSYYLATIVNKKHKAINVATLWFIIGVITLVISESFRLIFSLMDAGYGL